MSFGQMPIANGFLNPEQYKDEYFYEMATAVCDKCLMFQLIEQPTPEKMFHENYAFFSQTSKHMCDHFQSFAEKVIAQYQLNKDSFVVELGSNDGIMLKHFANQSIPHLGVEPSANVARVASERGINTLCTFFNEQCANEIKDKYGLADAIMAANVMCHIPDLNSLAAGVATLLKPNGVLIFQDPYLADVLEKTSYDQIYDEHVFLFCLHSVQEAFKPHGLELIESEHFNVHGGSMRYTLAKTGAYPVQESVNQYLNKEKAINIHSPDTYLGFKSQCEKSKTNLMEILNRLKDDNAVVAGYGATSKSTTIINYCGITADHLDYISDTTPIKQNKFSPGAHIPIKPYESFTKQYPNYALLFAWNHKNEIMAKEQDFKSSGGQWIEFIPHAIISEG